MARSNETPLSERQLGRLNELRNKKRDDKEEAEFQELRAREHIGAPDEAKRPAPADVPTGPSVQEQQRELGTGAPPPIQRPLSPDEVGRLRELKGRQEPDLSDEEKAELGELERRHTPQAANVTDQIQRQLSPDRPVQPPRDLDRDEANRLRDLRVANERGQLTDEERSEMGQLSAKESELAGHAVPPEAGNADPSWIFFDTIVSLIEQMVAVEPKFRLLLPQLRQLRQQGEMMRNPDAAANPAIRQSDMKTQHPGPNP